MAEPFMGEIRMFGGNYAPRGWALCDGQLMGTGQNDALFSLLGTVYGGDGRTTFGLPDLRGRIPIHQGQGPGLPNYKLGHKAGAEKVKLSADEVPSHNHDLVASNQLGNAQSPTNHTMARLAGGSGYKTASTVTLRPTMAGDAIAAHVGGGKSHNNMMPYLCVNFIIALFGIYPSRN